MASAEPRRGAPVLSTLVRAGAFLVSVARPLAWLLVAAWMLFIWTLSAQDFSAEGPSSFGWSVCANLAHAPLFGLLGLLLASALVRRAGGRAQHRGLPALEPRLAIGIVLAVALWGAIDEWHQASTPGRDSSLSDLLTDVVGAACVLWIVRYVGHTHAREIGLIARLALCVLACLAAALLASLDRAG